MPVPNVPTLLYPRGGEVIFAQQIVIQWELPNPPSSDGRTVFTEVFYTDRFDTAVAPDWKQIAFLPYPVQQFVWVPRGVRSNQVRFAVRLTNDRGERSMFSVSGSNVSIQRRQLTLPSVISPVSGGRYDQYISLQTDDAAILNTVSQRTYYQFYYSSASAAVARTPVTENIPVGSDPYIWNIVDLPPANDYVLEVFLADDDGNTSDRVFIPLQIAHEGYFILDTVPPEAAITVNNNASFTNSRNVTVQIVSYDETTAAHSMQLIEGSSVGPPDAIGNARTFQLSDSDGIKAVELLLQDFGGNRNDQITQRLFQVLVENDGTEIADIAFDEASGVLWAVTSGSGNYLYRVVDFPSRKTTFADEPTAVAVYLLQPYIATKTANNTGTILKFSDAQETVNVFTAQDSVVNVMTVHGNDLFLGMENGSIYQYDGTGFSLVQQMSNPVKELVSDGNLLYAALENDLNVYVHNGTSFSTAGA